MTYTALLLAVKDAAATALPDFDFDAYIQEQQAAVPASDDKEAWEEYDDIDKMNEESEHHVETVEENYWSVYNLVSFAFETSMERPNAERLLVNGAVTETRYAIDKLRDEFHIPADKLEPLEAVEAALKVLASELRAKRSTPPQGGGLGH